MQSLGKFVDSYSVPCISPHLNYFSLSSFLFPRDRAEFSLVERETVSSVAIRQPCPPLYVKQSRDKNTLYNTHN